MHHQAVVDGSTYVSHTFMSAESHAIVYGRGELEEGLVYDIYKKLSKRRLDFFHVQFVYPYKVQTSLSTLSHTFAVRNLSQSHYLRVPNIYATNLELYSAIIHCVHVQCFLYLIITRIFFSLIYNLINQFALLKRTMIVFDF